MRREHVPQSSRHAIVYVAKCSERLSRKMSVLSACLITFICFIFGSSLHAQGPNFEWVKNMSGANWENGYAITLDGEGNSYTTGLFRGTVDFDPGDDSFKLSAVGGTTGNTLFVSKLDHAGNFVWARSFGNSKFNYAYGIARDRLNNIYVAGYYYGVIDFDPGPDTFNLTSAGTGTTSDIFVMKLDADGNFVWAKGIGSTGNDQAFSIAVDGSDNVLVGGKFIGAVDFDPDATGTFIITPPNNAFNSVILKLNAAGEFIWAKDMGQVTRPNSTSTAYALAIDSSRNIYTAGYFRDTVDFDPGVGVTKLVSKGDDDIFLSKLDSLGNFQWARSFGSKRADQGSAITLDGDNNIYMTGVFNDTVDFDPGPAAFNLIANNTQHLNIVILKLDNNGDFIWAKDLGGPSPSAFENNYAFSVKTDKVNNCYITGYFNGTVDFDPGPGNYTMNAVGASDIFLLKLRPSGDFVWSKQIGGPDIDVTRSSVLDASGSIYTTGWFKATTDFNPGAGTSYLSAQPGFADIFVLKLNCGDTSSSTVTGSADCSGYTLNGTLYTETGVYVQHLVNMDGCDSTITLNLTIIPVLDMDITITVDVNKLGTVEHFATYQWLLNGQPIPGATDSTYTVTSNGDYRVVVTNEHGCADTSDVYTVTNITGIKDVAALAGLVKIYPNPSDDMVNIKAPEAVNVTIAGIDGRQLIEVKNAHRFSIKALAPGLYLLNVRDTSGLLIKTVKLIKQ